MEEILIKILSVAARSPSSHNTQPWRLRMEADSLLIGYELERHLSVGDPEKRELFISLGCYAESIVLAAADQGYSGRVAFLGTDPDTVARITFKKLPGKHTDWSKLIRQRRSDRRFYEDRPLPPETASSLKHLSYPNVSLKLFTDREEIDFLADKTYEATLELMTAPDFRNELATWVRPNWTRQPDGMPGYTQGMPTPVSLLAKPMIRKNSKVAVSQAKKDSKRVRRSAAIGLICISENSAGTWFSAGRLYQMLCVSAEKEDIKTAAVSAAIIMPDTSREIARHLKLATPVVLVRLGYKRGRVKATPRRPVSDVIVD